jgi:hypothetical protein
VNTLVLERFSYAPDGTFGVITFPSGVQLYTAERPWLGNKPSVSCIPEGVYALGKRESRVVSRTSGGSFTEGWEVKAVPGRTFIMVHPGNYPLVDLEGCIAVGKEYQILMDKKGVPRNAVGLSRAAFEVFMREMDTSKYWDLEIFFKRATYP